MTKNDQWSFLATNGHSRASPHDAVGGGMAWSEVDEHVADVRLGVRPPAAVDVLGEARHRPLPLQLHREGRVRALELLDVLAVRIPRLRATCSENVSEIEFEFGTQGTQGTQGPKFLQAKRFTHSSSN